jgi:hypothetical protein
MVLTMYSGEAEYDRCRESLKRQDYSDWEHVCFENQPNAEAHTALYRMIVNSASRYDLFFKLDADMVLADDQVLADLVRVFEQQPGLDHLVVAVSDWMTRSRIIGAHVFSNRVRWTEHEDRLRVDPDPVFPGAKLVVESPSRDLIFHCDDPTPLQAFHFGAHRALKAVQFDRGPAAFRAYDAWIQWHALGRVWRHYTISGDRRLGLAMLAADMVLRQQLPQTANEYRDEALGAAFDAAEALDDAQLRTRVETQWSTSGRRLRAWMRALGPAKSTLVVLRRVRDAAAQLAGLAAGRRSRRVAIGDASDV